MKLRISSRVDIYPRDLDLGTFKARERRLGSNNSRFGASVRCVPHTADEGAKVVPVLTELGSRAVPCEDKVRVVVMRYLVQSAIT
jgi:hypothetical protein